MKAITITQPNASLLAIGAITEISSTRYTAYRGPVAVFAASSFPMLEQMKLRNSTFRPALAEHYADEDLDVGNLPTGQIVGVGKLEDCVVNNPLPHWVDDPKESYLWRFSNMRLLAEPIACQCERGLTDLPERIAERLEVFA